MSSSKEEKKPPENGDDDSDVEIEGMDMEGDDEVEASDDVEKSSNAENDNETEPNASNNKEKDDDNPANDEATAKLATDDHNEMEAARKEQMELMAVESKKAATPKGASVQEQLKYLLNQSEVFAHFLAGEFNNIFPRRQR